MKSKAPVDPIQKLHVWLEVNETSVVCGARKPTHRNCEKAEYQAEPAQAEMIEEGSGFSAYVFDSEERYRGFRDALPIIDGAQEDVSHDFAFYPQQKLYVVAIRTPYCHGANWHDLRGKNVMKAQ